jgi:CheY-like chemotaxis protein
LILLDAQMPDGDSFALAKRFSDKFQVPIVMMLSTSQSVDVNRCPSPAIRSWVFKPNKQSDLADAIMLAVFGHSAVTKRWNRLDHIVNDDVPPLRILLVEDHPINQKFAVEALGAAGPSVIVTSNGRDAIAAVETQVFDLVLMDIQMPIMDGLEATTRTRTNEAKSGGHVPIIAMTAHALRGDREKCLAAGMDGYITKPVTVKRLLEELGDFASRSDSVTSKRGDEDLKLFNERALME